MRFPAVTTRFSALMEMVRASYRRRAALALVVGLTASLVATIAVRAQRTASARARLDVAVHRLDSLMDRAPADHPRRAAIAWGYAERLRLGLESPFRLVEAAGRDPRLTADERRTVAWGLLGHVLRGESHDIDAAALDGLGPVDGNGGSAAGEDHLRLIDAAVTHARNPRSAELALRLAYTLASAERLVDGAAPVLVAEVAALVADREIAHREAIDVIRSANGSDPLEIVRRRRARRGFYVERPVLLAPTPDLERDAVDMSHSLLDSIRSMKPRATPDASAREDGNARVLVPRLYAAGAVMPPAAPLAVTVRRYLPMVHGEGSRIDEDALARSRNSEMLVAATHVTSAARGQRTVLGRLLLAAGVAMRSSAQEPIWFPTDSAPTAADVVRSEGLAGVSFDGDVPLAWRPYFVRSLAIALRDLRRVLPAPHTDALRIRFRMRPPADSALAMHDPRTRTLHLPVLSAAGTLTHELAHDLDRQSAQRDGLAGYRSDIVARRGESRRNSDGRLAASLRALTEELTMSPKAGATASERPAEIFATRVDWFVASALAKQGVSNGFLSAVEDELLTGHVVHPERLRTSGRSRSLLAALEGMTLVSAFAASDAEPSAQTLLRWSLTGPVDRREAGSIIRGDGAFSTPSLLASTACARADDPRVELIRMAAESRARGWLRLRARWTPSATRTAWAHSALGDAPWTDGASRRRVAELRDYILSALASSDPLPAGLSAYGAPIATAARAACRQ